MVGECRLELAEPGGRISPHGYRPPALERSSLTPGREFVLIANGDRRVGLLKCGIRIPEEPRQHRAKAMGNYDRMRCGEFLRDGDRMAAQSQSLIRIPQHPQHERKKRCSGHLPIGSKRENPRAYV